MAKAMLTPNDLAEKLAGKGSREVYGKRVRSFLRATFPRNVKNVSWVLTEEQIATVTAWHTARTKGQNFDAQAFLKSRRTRSRKPKEVTPANE
jgi:hypothetical protein